MCFFPPIISAAVNLIVLPEGQTINMQHAATVACAKSHARGNRRLCLVIGLSLREWLGRASWRKWFYMGTEGKVGISQMEGGQKRGVMQAGSTA